MAILPDTKLLLTSIAIKEGDKTSVPIALRSLNAC